MENVPMDISRFQFWHFKKSTFWKCWKSWLYIVKTYLFAGFGVSQQGASVSQLPAALRRPQKKHAPGFLRHASSGFWLFGVPLGSLWLPLGTLYIVNLVDFHGFEVPLDFFSKSGQSSQMTMPARRSPKFSAKRRAILLHIIFQSWISEGFLWNIEPWPECQPELFEHGDRY